MPKHVTTAEAVALTKLPNWALWNLVRNGTLPVPRKISQRKALWSRLHIENIAGKNAQSK